MQPVGGPKRNFDELTCPRILLGGRKTVTHPKFRHLRTRFRYRLQNFKTANGKPATIAAAHDRLARMVCCDRTEFTAEDAQSMAHFLADIQQRQIAGALQQVLQKLELDCSHVLISGSGSFLAEKIVRSESRLQSAKITRLQDLIGNRTSDAACAFAVALLASERLTA